MKGRKFNIPDDVLKHFYIDERLTLKEVAHRLNASEAWVHKRVHALGIARSRSELACKGSAHHFWRGGRSSWGDGYTSILRPEHPRANGHGYVAEHTLVWEKIHGRPLPDGWIVHHLNGRKLDNQPENLFAMPKHHHSSHVLLNELKRRIRRLEQENKHLKSQSNLMISSNELPKAANV